MLDLGASFVASVPPARDPDVTAIVDGGLRMTYAQWYARISSVVAAFDTLGLESGDRIVTMLQNRWEAAGDDLLGVPIYGHYHYADQLARKCGRTRLLYRECGCGGGDLSASFCRGGRAVQTCARGAAYSRGRGRHGERRRDPGSTKYPIWGRPTQPRARTSSPWSIMLLRVRHYLEAGKGVPAPPPRGARHGHRACRAENLYRRGERTLGVMPLYHTMGVRSLIAMSLVGGAFVCLPHYDARQALGLIEAEKIANLYFVPTSVPRFRPQQIARREKHLERTASSASPGRR